MAVSQNRNTMNQTGPFVMGVQASSIPIIFVDGSDDAHLVALANASFLGMTGKTDSEVLRQPLDIALTGMMDASNVDFIAERLALNQPGTWDIECRRPDGSGYIAAILVHPLRDLTAATSQHIVSFCILNAQTERLSSSAEQARMLYQHAPGFIGIAEGAEHRITFANDSYKQFVGQQQLEGFTVAEAMPDIAAQGFVAILDTVFETGVPYRGDAVAFDFTDPETGTKVRRYADFVYEPVRDADGNIVGIFCEGYDITRQKDAEAVVRNLQTQVAHASRVNAMGTMATTMAHELNQPLSSIVNYASGCLRLLDNSNLDIGELKQAMLSVRDSGNRAGAIIRTLRDLTDRRVRANSNFALKPVVEESLDLVRSSCSLDTKFDIVIPPDLTLDADRVQIQQVVINLIRNGCDAVADLDLQKVVISAEATSQDVIVSVRDTGPGIGADSAESMFTWSDSVKDSGMGLGLSISRTIIEAHNGNIWLEESSPQGSDFRFSLPIASDQTSKTGRDSHAGSSSSKGKLSAESGR